MGPNSRAQERERAAAEAEKIVAIWNARQGWRASVVVLSGIGAATGFSLTARHKMTPPGNGRGKFVALAPRSVKARPRNGPSIIDVEIALKARGRFFVSGVLHHVELPALLVEHRAGLNFTGALLHGRLVLGGGYFLRAGTIFVGECFLSALVAGRKCTRRRLYWGMISVQFAS